MAMSETQLAGLKKNPQLISDSDLARVLTHLGLRRVVSDEPGSLLYEMAIMDGWTARCRASEVKFGQKSGYQVDFFVYNVALGSPVGPTYRSYDAGVFQLRGARVMSQLFESVDDTTPFACPSCDEGMLHWDGRTAARVHKPGMKCPSCEFR